MFDAISLASAGAIMLGLYWTSTRRNPLRMLALALEWMAIACEELPGAVVRGWQHWHLRMTTRWRIRSPVSPARVG